VLSSKISAQTPVFIAFSPFITIPNAKSGFNYYEALNSEHFYKTKTPTQRIGVKYMASTLLVVMFPKDMEATGLSLD
jgi:hypothetical protein